MHGLAARVAEPVEECGFEGEARGWMPHRVRAKHVDEEVERARQWIRIDRRVDEASQLV